MRATVRTGVEEHVHEAAIEPIGARRTARAGAAALVAALVAVVVAASAVGAAPAPSAAPAPTPAAVNEDYVIGARTVATPAAGGRTLWVAPDGSDKVTYPVPWGTKTVSRHMCLRKKVTDQVTCPAATRDRPLRTVQAAVLSAQAADVIVVRGGTYREAIGWNAASGSKSRRVVLQSYPGERVEVRGTLVLKRVSYWTVRGLHFLHESSVQGTGQAIVNLQGGTGWVFTNNEVAGSPGVANVMITPGARTGSATARAQAGPANYAILRNCIRDNRGRNAHGMDHNIYLMAGIYSRGGRIERNLLAGAPNGAQIKVAASTWKAWQDSPRHVAIRNNTMLNGAAGVTIGVAAQDILVEGNIVANQVNGSRYDAAIKTWELERHDLTTVTGNYLAGYTTSFRVEPGKGLVTSRNVVAGRIATVGSVSGCTAKPASESVRARYGQRADR